MIYGLHLYNIGFFFRGMLLATLPMSRAVMRVPWGAIVVIIAAAIVALQYSVAADINATLAIAPVPMLLVWGILVSRADDSYQARLPITFGGLIPRSPLRAIELCGMMSYSIYVLHKPLAYLAIEKIGMGTLVTGPVPLAATTALVLLLPLPIFAISFILVERRLRLLLSVPLGAKAPQNAA